MDTGAWHGTLHGVAKSGGPGRPGRGQPVLAVVVGQRDHPPEAPSQERMEGLLKAAWRPWKQDEEWRGIIFKWGELPESQAACKGGLYYAKLPGRQGQR